MKWPWVSRLAYELALTQLGAETARADALVSTITTMRQQGFTAARAATVREAPDEESIGLAQAEQKFIQRRDDVAFIERAAADMMRRVPGISKAQAMTEAAKLRRQVTDEDAPV